MVDVLTVSGGRGPRSPLAERVRNEVTGADIMRPYSMTAEALGHLGNRLEEANEPYQEAAGARSVEMDEDGNPRVNFRFGFTRGDRAFNAGARQAALAKWKTGFADEMQQLRVKHANDPQAFQAAAEVFVKRAGKNDPLLAPFMEQEAASVAGQHYRGLLTDQQNNDRQRFSNDLKARETHLTGQLERLFEEGGGNTPEAQALLGEMFDLRRSLAGNPEFAYSDVQREIDDERTTQHLQALAVVGEFRRQYRETGDLAGTIAAAEERISALGLPPDQAQKYLAQVTQRNSAAAEIRRIQKQEATESADAMIAALPFDSSIDGQQIDAAVANLRRLGAHGQATKLEAARIVNDLSPVFESGTAAEKSAALTGLRGRIAARAGEGRVIDTAQTLRDFEGFRSRPYWDVNAYRVGYGSDTITRADGTVVRVTKDMTVTREDAERDLARRTKEFQGGIVAAIGQEAWDEAPENVRAVLSSVAYNYGRLPRSVARAAASGEPELLAEAIEGLKGHNDGVNAGRRQREADMVRGGGAAGSAAYVEATRQLQAKYNDSAVELWGGIKRAFDDGHSPTADELSELVALFPLISNDKTRKEISDRLQQEGALDALSGVEQFRLREMIAESEEAAAAGDLDGAQRELLRAMDRRAQEQEQRLANDPLSLATGAGPIADELGTGARAAIGPLQFGDHQALGRQLGERGVAARAISGYHRRPLGSVLRPDDIPQIQQMLQTGDAGTVAAFFGAIEGLDDDLLFATMGDKKLADSVGGLMKTTDPQKHGAAMSGMDQLLRRNEALFVGAFGNEAVALVRSWQDSLVFATEEQQARVLARRLDGNQPAIVKEWEAQADAFVKKEGKNAASIAQELLGTFERAWRGELPTFQGRAALENDYRQLLKENMVITGDIEAAHGATITQMRTVWGTSSANGGRLMKHAPERHYQTVDGSHDWIGSQIQADIRERIGTPDNDAAPSRLQSAVARAEAFAAGREELQYSLVATPQTQADIAAGQPPAYQVVYVDPNTGMLEAVMWRGDAEREIEPVRERMRRLRESDDAARERGRANVDDPDFNAGRRGIEELERRRNEGVD
jgi:GH24 family phage-related lysozyme (muramidase)